MFNRRKQIILEAETPENTGLYKPRLIFTEDMLIEKEDEYLFRYHANQLPDLELNQLSVEALQVDLSSSPISIVALFRNTLENSFHVDGLPLLVLDEANRLIGRKVLTTEDIPEFVPMSSMPCWLDFSEEELFLTEEENFPEKIRLLFSLEETHDLEIPPDFLDTEARRVRQTFYSTPTLKNEEVNVMNVWNEKNENRMTGLFLIRNGYEQAIQLGTLPLQLMNGEQILQTLQVALTSPIEAKTTLAIKVVLDVTEWQDQDVLQFRVAQA